MHATPSPLGIHLLRSAVLYLLLGLLLGIAMAASHQFALRPVHTHVNLLGWATLALTGLVYCLFPHAAASRLAIWHARLHNLGLPLMLAGLAAYSLGYTRLEPLIAIGALLLSAGLLLFAAVVYLRLAPRQAACNAYDTPAVSGAKG
ncbi:MAG: cytochrome-c oxidase [Pseudomonadota bacterium]